MIKFLYLVRHAQAEEYAKSNNDFDRELTNKGKTDSALIGTKLYDMSITPQKLITSPGLRALQTAEIICDELHQKRTDIQQIAGIYNASAPDLLEIIHQIDEGAKSAALFGHNPGFYEIANLLSDTQLHKFSKSGVVALAFSVPWKNINSNTGMLQFYLSPKQYI